MFALRCGPVVGLSALTGTAAAIRMFPLMGTASPSTSGWMDAELKPFGEEAAADGCSGLVNDFGGSSLWGSRVGSRYPHFPLDTGAFDLRSTCEVSNLHGRARRNSSRTWRCSAGAGAVASRQWSHLKWEDAL